MLHDIIDLFILIGVWVNAYINIHHYKERKRRNL